MNTESADSMLADAVAKRMEVVEGQKNDTILKLGIWEARLEKLASIQEKRKLEVADEFTMAKAGISQTTEEISDLQNEIRKAFTQKTFNEKELAKLETRLKSLEAILPSANNQKN